ncbi:MAG: hypothetical protein QGG36_09280 [Pirellulaceae bacterium]|nr:hypothetical protein [Pirellulaceae bacterium]MDP7015978.1 hypothetical protein [Pirellulaceae bacterium]
MSRYRCWAIVFGLLSWTGCHWRQPPVYTGPEMFHQPPTVREIVDVVNANSGKVKRLQTSRANISVQGYPGLEAELALERPRRLRLQARVLGVGGPQVDIGSNDDLFWFWAPNVSVPGLPKGLLYSRHEDFAQTPMRRLLPVEPHWIMEALGMITLDPNAEYRGPYSRGGRQVEIHTPVRTAQGDLLRVLVVHDTYGWVMEQHLKDATGRIVASARADRYKFYEEDQVALPEEVTITLNPGRPEQLQLTIQVAHYAVNRIIGDDRVLFTMPDTQPSVDLASPGLAQPPAAAPLGGRRQSPLDPRVGYRPSVRGYSR